MHLIENISWKIKKKIISTFFTKCKTPENRWWEWWCYNTENPGNQRNTILKPQNSLTDDGGQVLSKILFSRCSPVSNSEVGWRQLLRNSRVQRKQSWGLLMIACNYCISHVASSGLVVFLWYWIIHVSHVRFTLKWIPRMSNDGVEETVKLWDHF